MAEKRTRKTIAVLLALALFLAAPALFPPAAFAADDTLEKLLPGQWSETYENQEEEDAAEKSITSTMVFEADGKMGFAYIINEGETVCIYEGTWEFEFVPDVSDRLHLHFTSTDNPKYAGVDYDVECVYDIYTESWVQNDTEFIYLLFMDASKSAVTPFEEAGSLSGMALHREKGPNMMIANCKDFVSLRAKQSKTSTRLAKVPLGAQVLAFPEYGEENGFVFCYYQDQAGYILSEYLAPIE